MIRGVYLLLLLCSLSYTQTTISISEQDSALLLEAFHLQAQLGPKVWKGWEGVKVPFLYRKDSMEFLLNHPLPSLDFESSEMLFYNQPIYWKRRSDFKKINASYPINGIATVIMSSPGEDEIKIEWVLKACHEMFHVFQENKLTKKLRETHEFDTGQYSGTNEISFPYPYAEDKILAIQKLESEKIFRLLKSDSLEIGNVKIQQRRFTDIIRITRELLKEQQFAQFKSHMEWKEGVARYVEQKLALKATENYSPSEGFITYYPKENYKMISPRYSYASTVAPIRFVGEGVIGKIMFYYLGMGKAYLLDRIQPDWKQEYFKKSLDELIVGEEQYLMCTQF
ncbi:MAG: hypothetical protein AAF717_02950 [Bacteroidota bacterium]